MRRRDLLAVAAGGLALAAPRLAAAQSARIGLIGVGFRQDNRSIVDAFRAALAALGWSDGANATIIERWAEGRAERLPGLVSDLIGAGADLLVTAGAAATLAAARATAVIPIVLVGVGDPLAIGVVESHDHPGGNATGLSLNSPELVVKRLGLLHELVPGLHRVAIIVRSDPGIEQTLVEIHASAGRRGLEPFKFEVTTGRTVELAFIHLRNDHCEAIYVASGPLGPAKRAQIIALAARVRLPAVYSFGEFALGGGLMSLAADMDHLFHRAAGFADKILKGAKPADLPVEQPTKFELAINLKTAKALGLTVPQSLLARADEVIE